ncbi:MAG: T9SS type A sorting domain-containing protein [Cytophagaceae bacterium]|nr:T9SS type A sorting domain-containing protein [Cytophagaceae bacterium]
MTLSRQVKNTLFDINGKAALSQVVNGSSAQINMSRLLAGNYILRLVENGKASVEVKIAK